MARPKKNADVVEDLVTTDETVDETTDETVDTTEETTEETTEDTEKKLDDLVMVTDTEEEKAEDETSADSSDDDVTIQSAVKKVKVKVKKDHSCCIGGIWYNLVAGKETNVPEDVKRILASANLLEVM